MSMPDLPLEINDAAPAVLSDVSSALVSIAGNESGTTPPSNVPDGFTWLYNDGTVKPQLLVYRANVGLWTALTPYFGTSTPVHLTPSWLGLMAGDLWLHSGTGALKFYNGSTWAATT